jgi:hypothetical protein
LGKTTADVTESEYGDLLATLALRPRVVHLAA